MPKSAMPEHVWMNGKLIPCEQATIHVFTPCARYGTNAFEGLRAYWNEEKNELYAFRIREHYERLFESMKIMGLSIDYSLADCENFLMETIRANKFREDLHIRHTVYVDGYGGYAAQEPVGMFILPRPRGRAYNLEKGISCSISSWIRISDNSVPPRAKVGSNYQNSRLATIEAKKNGYDAPIILTANGKVSESGGACFFMVRKGTVLTPSITSSILESVTRSTIIDLCKNELNLPVEEREIDRTEVYIAQEAFLCGSGAEVVPITSVDKIAVGDGKVGSITQKIVQIYFDVVRGNSPKYHEWLTPTYGK